MPGKEHIGISQGKAFGSASTLVAQMGILLGMLASNQPQSALVVASAASAISGSFGDAFSIYVSESTGKRDEPIVAATSVLITKLVIGAVYVLLFATLGKSHYILAIAILLTLFLLYYLSMMANEDYKNVNRTFLQYIVLTTLVVSLTSSFGFAIRGVF
jgi:ABC-type multidrug transport system permease subunit